MPTNPDALVSTDWVAEHLDDPQVRVVDVDEDIEAYSRSHIPGAVGLDWKADLQDPLRRTFLDAEGFARLMDERGITRDTHVVLYGGNNNWFAAYAYWYFKVYGHDAVALMDGGRKKWELEGRELTSDPTEVTPTSGYTPSEADPAIRARREQVLAQFVGAPEGTALIDVRSPAEFSGETTAPPHLPGEAAMVPGHIPGAANVPWGTAVNPDTGEFLPADQLREIYEGKGLTGDDEIVAYCRIGERSAHTWFVLHEILGYDRVRNYDGSWTEYGSLVDVPVER
ncbi:sulfurtransferase [Euzebya sp.]|uniref:sulfurtransferase n=1 Tax=Euzebya sp. TaxID=1971409 RepID=UPI0035163CFA